MNETGYFTVTTNGQRKHRFSFERAAWAAHTHSTIERVIKVEWVTVDGQLMTREHDLTNQAIDYLSTCNA